MESEETGKERLIVRDWLAIERTRLANERTFLAYMRTAIVFFASGISLIKFEVFEELTELGYFMIIAGPGILLFGIYRLFRVSQVIRKYY